MAQSKPRVDAALWKALERRDATLADQLLYDESHPDTPNFNGETPLTHAVTTLDLKMVDTLLSHGADPNLPNSFDTTPLMACCIGFPSGAQTLLLHGADPQKLNRFGQNPAAWAQRHPNDPLALLILSFDTARAQLIKPGGKAETRARALAEIQGAGDWSRLLAQKRQALSEALGPSATPRSPHRK